MMHAENGPAIDVLAAAARRGRARPTRTTTASPAPGRWRRRPPTARSCSPNLTGAPLYVVHVSAKQAVEQLAAARDTGQNVFGETCPQYLYLSLEEQLGASATGRFEGAKWVCSTPLRSRAEGHQDADVAGAAHQRPADGLHRPLPVLHEGPEGARASATSAPIPNGIGSIEHRMDLLYQGVVDRRDHARAVGRADLDDPGADVRAVRQEGRHPAGRRRRHRRSTTRTGTPRSGSSKTHHMNMDYSAWEGFEIDGHVDTVLSRGHGASSTTASYLGTQGPRPVRQARPDPVPDLTESDRDAWTSASSCRPTRPPARTVAARQAGRGSTGSATCGRSTRTCSGRSRTSSTARSWPRPTGSSSARWSPTRRPGTGRSPRRCSRRSTRCTATAPSAASAAATPPCASPTASRRRCASCARRST